MSPRKAPEPSDPAALATQTLRALRAEFVTRTAELPRTEDPEAVHHLRVLLRRLRVSLRLFRDQLPDGAPAALRAALRPFARALGVTRDAEVLCLSLRTLAAQHPAEAPALAALADASRDQAARAREALLPLLGGLRHKAPQRAWERLTRARPASDEGLARFARRALRKRARKILALAEAPPSPENLHALRLAAKDLHYATALLAPWLTKRLRRTAMAARKLQRALGEARDADAVAALLGEAPLPDTREALARTQRKSLRALEKPLRALGDLA